MLGRAAAHQRKRINETERVRQHLPRGPIQTAFLPVDCQITRFLGLPPVRKMIDRQKNGLPCVPKHEEQAELSFN